MVNISSILLTFIGLFIATLYDLKNRRIPNLLTISMTLAGFINSFINKGFVSLGEHVLAFLIGFIFYFLFYLVGAFGAGDVKLIASLGAIMGLKFILMASIIILLVGGIISFIILAKNNGLYYISKLLYDFFNLLFTGRIKQFKRIVTSPGSNSYPYTIAIFVGSMVTIRYMYPIN